MVIHLGDASDDGLAQNFHIRDSQQTFCMSCSGEPVAVCKLRIYDTIAGDRSDRHLLGLWALVAFQISVADQGLQSMLGNSISKCTRRIC
jgi:hypothetical protein